MCIRDRYIRLYLYFSCVFWTTNKRTTYFRCQCDKDVYKRQGIDPQNEVWYTPAYNVYHWHYERYHIGEGTDLRIAVSEDITGIKDVYKRQRYSYCKVLSLICFSCRSILTSSSRLCDLYNVISCYRILLPLFLPL